MMSCNSYLPTFGGCHKQIPDSIAQNFPEHQGIWASGNFKFLGSGIKYREILILKIQLYAIALYVEEDGAAEELQRLKKEGFFTDFSDDELCAALLRGRFKKYLQFRLLRDVSYSQFIGEIGTDLKPRLEKTGDKTLWPTFQAYFKKKTLRQFSNLLALQTDKDVEGGLYPASLEHFEHAKVDLTLDSSKAGNALFDVYLGSSGIVPEAKKAWAASALALLKSV